MYVRTREGLGQAVASIDVDRAVRLNRRYAQSLGWQVQRDRIPLFLGLTPMTGPRAFAEAVAQWQRSQPGLAVDGIIGPNTWLHLQSAMGLQSAQVPIEVKCPSTYKSGEIAKSRTSGGHLAPDVRLLGSGRLLIADFGVNWRHVKPSTTKEKVLSDWLKTFETDPTYRLKIIGYTDCVGPEKHNASLRKARAEQVYALLGPGAQSRVISKGSAPVSTYVADNSTIQGRAMNRGVIIEFQKGIEETIAEEITGELNLTALLEKRWPKIEDDIKAGKRILTEILKEPHRAAKNLAKFQKNPRGEPPTIKDIFTTRPSFTKLLDTVLGVWFQSVINNQARKIAAIRRPLYLEFARGVTSILDRNSNPEKPSNGLGLVFFEMGKEKARSLSPLQRYQLAVALIQRYREGVSGYHPARTLKYFRDKLSINAFSTFVNGMASEYDRSEYAVD
jgi:outer membrane protein OmpA-like peptidoglycan-associated protein